MLHLGVKEKAANGKGLKIVRDRDHIGITWDKDRVSSFELRLEPVRNQKFETRSGGKVWRPARAMCTMNGADWQVADVALDADAVDQSR